MRGRKAYNKHLAINQKKKEKHEVREGNMVSEKSSLDKTWQVFKT